MKIKQVFAGNLRRYRLANGISQEDLAYKAGIDRTYVGSLERCVYSASIEVVAKLAEALEVEPWRLLVEPSDPVSRDTNIKKAQGEN